MAHNRKLVLGGVALTMARLPAKKNAAVVNLVRDEIEQEIIRSKFLINAPFKWVSIIVRYGLIDEISPHHEKINEKYGDLPLAIEIDVRRLLGISEDEMAAVYRKAALIALVHAGEKYGLSVERFKQLLKAL